MGGLMNKKLLLLVLFSSSVLISVSWAATEKFTSIYLKAANTILADGSKLSGGRAERSAPALKSKLAILNYSLNENSAIAEAHKLPPFYASLALAGMAATSIGSSPEKADKLFKEALQVANEIAPSSDRIPTSLGYLFQIIPHFPKTKSLQLLKDGLDALKKWKAPARAKSFAMFTLAEATIAVNPSGARDLLLNQTLTDYAFDDANRLLGQFLVQQSSADALLLVRQVYKPNQSPPSESLMDAVLVEYAKQDFEAAFSEVKRMADPWRVIACFNLAESLLKRSQREAAARVLDYMATLKSPMEVGKFTFTKLEDLLKEKERMQDRSMNGFYPKLIDPQIVDKFITNPREYDLRHFLSEAKIVFRDKKQAASFAEAATIAAYSLSESNYHGYDKSNGLGIAAVAAAIAGTPKKAIEISQQIPNPETKAVCLMEMHELRHPLSDILNKWPLAQRRAYDIETTIKAEPK